jgi:hypothetical protein
MPSLAKETAQAATIDKSEKENIPQGAHTKARMHKATVAPQKVLKPEHMAQINGLLLATLRKVYAQYVVVDIAALGIQQLEAKSLAGLSDADVGRDVVLGFEAGDPSRPIVIGAMLGSVGQISSITDQVQTTARVQPAEVVVDGLRVVLQAEHEIELRCGEAAIVLMADGRIQLRGTYITSQASATQRILGGSVNVN